MRWYRVLATLAFLGLCAVSGSVRAGLVAHYKLDDNAASTAVVEVGGLDGVFNVNTDTASVAGIDGNALAFNDVNFVELSAQSAAFTGLGDYAVSMWVKGYDGSASNELFTVSDGTLGNRLQLELHAGSLSTYAAGFGGSAGPALTWDPNTWYHIVFSNEAGTLTITRSNDGAQNIVGGSPGFSQIIGANNINIGELASGGPGSFIHSGQIDDVQVYDTALNSAQIGFLFNNPGSAVPEPSSIALTLLGLLALSVYRRRRFVE